MLSSHRDRLSVIVPAPPRSSSSIIFRKSLTARSGTLSSVFDRPVLILIDQIRLHRLILFHNNVKLPVLRRVPPVRIEGFLFSCPLTRNSVFVISAEVSRCARMICSFRSSPYPGRESASRGSAGFNIFHHIVDLRPHCIIEDQVIRRRLHRGDRVALRIK